jgi:hypothetical protein
MQHGTIKTLKQFKSCDSKHQTWNNANRGTFELMEHNQDSVTVDTLEDWKPWSYRKAVHKNGNPLTMDSNNG